VVRPINNVSCATCHFEGRDDGLTWPLQRGRRQTPSLAGEVSARAPVTWTGEAATVAEDAMRTSQTLMGGGGLSAHEAEQIARYIDFVRPVDVPDRADVGAAERGRALFESADVGCASCHTGAQLTDNLVHIMPGSREGFKTPSLRGLAATPPYLHDGSAPDLRSLLERAESMRMSGRPLDRGEIADMEAYLRTL